MTGLRYTPSARGQRVLFVDDSRLMRFAAQRFLADEFDTTFAADGRKAWDALRADPRIGAMITDLLMPEMDGVELIRTIRAADSVNIRSLPILVVTGVEETAGRRRALDAGANDLLPKPFSRSDLVEPVRAYFERRAQPADGPMRALQQPNIEASRDRLVARIEQLASFHDRHGLEFSLVHVRVDDYHALSGRYGLNWAESVMRHVERVLARQVRLEDTLGRSADDCFSILLMSTPAAGAKRLRDRLRERLASSPARYPGRTLDPALRFAVQVPDLHRDGNAEAMLSAGLQRLNEPANVTRLTERITA